MPSLRELADLLRSDRITRTALADGSGVVLDVKGLAVYSFNETGMFLVEAVCEGATDSDALVARLMAAFEVDEATARTDVDAFIAEFSGLLAT